MSARLKVTSATVYVDAIAGSDANDGTSPALALQTLQKAFNVATSNFDVNLSSATWTEQGNVGYSSGGITIQMAPAPAATPYTLSQPVFCRASPSGVITLRGDPANGLAYNIYSANSLQGITAQEGGVVVCDGFTIRGAPNCTSLNTLRGGYMSIKNVWFGGVAEGRCAPIGAAGGSQVDIIGPIYLIGSGFVAVFTTLEGGRIMLCHGHEIHIHNAMDFGVMCNVSAGDMWTQGTPPYFTGHKTDSIGAKYNCYWSGRLMFDHNLIPGTGGASDATSTVL